MKDYKIKLADKVIRIINLYEDTYTMCLDYLSDEVEDFIIETTQKDIESERKQTILEAQYEGIAVYPYTDAMLESTATYRKIALSLLKYHCSVFHGAVVARGNEAYLFTAKSGIGKTTHIHLWLKQFKDAYVVNGDKPILMLKENQLYVCGSPWCGKEGYNTNTIVPLKSICIVERSKENRITKITYKEALQLLLQQIYRPSDPELLEHTLEMVDTIGKTIPLYKLQCNMEDDAAIVSYEGMQ